MPNHSNDFDSDYEEEESTVFHRIISKEIPADFLYEDDRVAVIKDINPVAPVHFLVIPKKTIPALSDVSDEDEALLGHMFKVAVKVANENGVSNKGYRVIINSGRDGGQEVAQLHMHVIGGRVMNWPPG